jgi:hypothetical protein
MNVHCKYDSLIKCNSLKPHPKNRNKHPEDQIERLAKILEYQGVRAPIVVSKRSGNIVKGHGTLKAIKKNGWTEAPVVYQDFTDEDQEWLFLQSDNAIAMWAELDLKGINADLEDLGPFDIDLIGIKNFTENASDKDLLSDFYSTKIESPVYTPKGENPPIKKLVDKSKTKKLVEDIEAKDLDKEIKEFLIAAAQRHNVFNYELIAEYYAHAPKDVQELMENSALVIIDFKKAIEHGFVQLTQDLTEAYKTDEQ